MENNSFISIIDRIDAIRAELFRRSMYNQLNKSEFEHKTWNELCEEGISLFHELKSELIPSSKTAAQWIRRYDYDMEAYTYLCSNCDAEYVGLPRSPVCPRCKALIVGEEE